MAIHLSKVRVLLFIMTLLLFCSGIFTFQSLQAQNDVKLGQIDIEINQVSWNGNPVKYDTLQTHQLQKGENYIIVYQNKKLAYLVQLIYKRSASKINLSQRLIVEEVNGNRHYGKLSKSQHKVNDPNSPMIGKLDDTITYDKKTMSTGHIKLSYILY